MGIFSYMILRFNPLGMYFVQMNIEYESPDIFVSNIQTSKELCCGEF